MQSIDICPVCEGTIFRPYHTCTDHTVSHETFNIKVCQNCSLGITSPRPDDADLSGYYQSEQYISHSGKSSGLLGHLYRTVRKFTLQSKRKLLERGASGKTILDYGCGTGEFLQEMKARGWKVAGLEPSQTARYNAERLINGTIYEKNEDLQSQYFDVITLWHVLEHIPHLDATLQQLRNSLASDGMLYLAVPNYHSPDANHYHHHWAGFDVPRHLWHFTKESMTRLLKKEQLEIVQILPMKLDAFYVSLLSERNRQSNPVSAYLRAFYHGLHSNWLASTTVSHSSLIYIAKKT